MVKKENSDSRAAQIANLKRELFFHRERRKMVEADRTLTPERQQADLACHDAIIKRLRAQLASLEGR